MLRGAASQPRAAGASAILSIGRLAVNRTPRRADRCKARYPSSSSSSSSPPSSSIPSRFSRTRTRDEDETKREGPPRVPPPPFRLAEPGPLSTLAPLMKTSSRALVLMAAAGLAAAASLISCNRGGDGGIKVGEFASLTGKEATFGISSHEGTQLAIEEINAAGGVLGKKIELLTEDNQSKAGEPANVVNKLISRDGVVAVLGEVASSRSLEAAPICQQNKIPMISPASTNPKVTEDGRLYFPRLFHRSVSGDGDGELRHEVTQGEKSRRADRCEERLLEGPGQVFQRAVREERRPDRRRNSITTAATRISKRSSPPSRARPAGGLCPGVLHGRRADLHSSEGTRPQRPALRW